MRTRVLIGAGLLVALLLAGVVSFYASGNPDGLNRVAQDHGFSATEKGNVTDDSPLAGYQTDGVDHGRLSSGIAGVTGALVVLAFGSGLAFAIRRRSDSPQATTAGQD